VGNTGEEPFVGDKDSDRSVALVVFDPKPVEAAAEAYTDRVPDRDR
jgi:hypothetical protein